MKHSLLKTVELAFRRFLIVLLGKIVHRRNKQQSTTNYSTAKYLFIRQDRIGDVLVSTPLFSLLKQRYPHATVDVFLSTNNHFVLQSNPHIRKRWVYTKKVFHTINLIRELRKERYDYAIDLMDNPSATSTLLCLLVGAAQTVGLEKENSYVYDIRVPLLSRRDVHIVERLAQLLSAFNIYPAPEELSLEYTPSFESRSFARSFYESENVLQKKKIGVNISAGSEARFWGVENFSVLVEYLTRNYPEFVTILLYSPNHYDRATTIQSNVRRVILSPMTHSFDQFAALMEPLDYLITPDTAAVHLASAFKIPSVVLYIQTNPDIRIWEPYRTLCEPIVTQIDDLKSISPEQVKEAFVKLLQRTIPKEE